MDDGGNSLYAYFCPCSSGLLYATGLALSVDHQVDNSAHSLSEHWPEHNAYELGSPEKYSQHCQYPLSFCPTHGTRR